MYVFMFFVHFTNLFYGMLDVCGLCYNAVIVSIMFVCKRMRWRKGGIIFCCFAVLFRV